MPRSPSTALRSARDDGLKRPAKILEPIQTFFDHVKARRITESNGAVVAERSPWHYRDVCFAQQAVGEILRRESKLADVHQHIKCALRFDCGDIGNLRDAIKHIVATHIEFF